MFILLFDIDASNGYRCHQYCLTVLCICVVLINRCGFVCTTGITSLKIDDSAFRSSSDGGSSSSSISIISPSPLKQPKPSSVIYISSLDDMNTVGSVHSSEHDIRFEDFFWNGSGDEPLTLSLKSNARLTAVNGFSGRETFIKTATVIATVYIDDSNEVDKDPDCELDNCDTDSNEIPDVYLSPNKRFWLVTTLYDHLTDEDIPLLQERLADVYRITFTKQQSLHLGLTNVTNESTNDQLPSGSQANDTKPIIENKESTNLSMPIDPTSVLKYEYDVHNSTAFNIQSNVSMSNATMSLQQYSTQLTETTNATSVSSISSKSIDAHRHKRLVSSISPSSVASATTTIDQHATQIAIQFSNAKLQSNMSDFTNSKSNNLQKLNENSKTGTGKPSKGAKKKERNDAIIGHISVLIHNISVISNAEKDYPDNSEKEWTDPVQGNSTSDPFITADNQTEIIYTVFVNGIPVLATIAANDMKLMSQAEVSKILDRSVFTKAEPYLKEPQATPLIPSSTMTTNQNKPILAMIFQNPYILAFIGALLLLIILLLMILMLITGTKNQRKTHKKGVSKSAQTSQQSFLPPVPVAMPSSASHSNANTTSVHLPSIDEIHQFRSNMTNEIPNRQSNNTTRQKKQVGTQITSLHDTVDGYERDHSFIIIPTPLKRKHNKKVGTPTIYFPEPPSSAPSSPSLHSQTQSSTSTSDSSSSIYYIKKHKNRRHHLYSKRPKRVATLNHREYATITKKQIERAQKKSKHKRKYLKSGNGNRVGAFEQTVQVHSSRSSSATGQMRRPDKECKASRSTNTVNAIAVSDDTFEISTGKDSNLYEHIEAFNPMVAKPKKNPNQFMSMKQMDNGGKTSTISNETEKHVQSKSRLIDKRQNKRDTVNHMRNGMHAFAANSVNDRQKRVNDDQPVKEAAQYSSDESRKLTTDRCSNQLSNDEVHTTNDDLSIGSFLSMASIRSFPKCNVPEPLNRVLEPVSTYFDRYDEIEATEAATMASKLPRIVDAKAKSPANMQQQKPRETTANKKSDEIVYLSRTRSDGADPGVIGPVAWQYHKKRLEEQENAKLRREPTTCTQHRYEDLLEGAISLYSIETTEYHTIETITKEEFPEILIGKDMRGKSADVFPNVSTVPKSSPKPYRPFTAMMSSKTTPEDPPITTKGAWTGSSLIHPTNTDLNPTNESVASSSNESSQKI